MSENDHLVGHCGKILPRGELCFPSFEDDLCLDCPLNGWEFLEEIKEEERLLENE